RQAPGLPSRRWMLELRGCPMLENSAAAVVWANSSRWLHERKSAQKTCQAIMDELVQLLSLFASQRKAVRDTVLEQCVGESVCVLGLFLSLACFRRLFQLGKMRLARFLRGETVVDLRMKGLKRDIKNAKKQGYSELLDATNSLQQHYRSLGLEPHPLDTVMVVKRFLWDDVQSQESAVQRAVLYLRQLSRGQRGNSLSFPPLPWMHSCVGDEGLAQAMRH
ncbi:unnamed protein product, partial [Effrenium voratum]